MRALQHKATDPAATIVFKTDHRINQLFVKHAVVQAADAVPTPAPLTAAGTEVFICPYLLHRHEAHWDRPEAFDPERFAPAAVEARDRFAYLPFSAGPRFCIGTTFSMAEMTMHLSMVAQRFQLRYAGSAPPQAEFQINLRTRQDVHMRLVAR